ncbi:MAG: hypothetical protein KIT66_08360 [Chitinophagaceae bacterium]|nr:hypothetical protein [Chitinophagaceae bacterium]MCZ2395287.1 hypothetical protein [Chitinophagales bacterium]
MENSSMTFIKDFARQKNKEEIKAVKQMLQHPLSYEDCIKQRDRNLAAIAENLQQLSKVEHPI